MLFSTIYKLLEFTERFHLEHMGQYRQVYCSETSVRIWSEILFLPLFRIITKIHPCDIMILEALVYSFAALFHDLHYCIFSFRVNDRKPDMLIFEHGI